MKVGDKVHIIQLTQLGIDSFPKTVGWHTNMGKHLGRTGVITYEHYLESNDDHSFTVSVEGFTDTWNWPPQYLMPVEEKLDHQKISDHKLEVLSELVKRAEDCEAERKLQPVVGARVQIRPLNEHQIKNFDKNIGFLGQMKMCFGREGKITSIGQSHVGQSPGPAVEFYAVDIDGDKNLRYNWPLSSLILLPDADDKIEPVRKEYLMKGDLIEGKSGETLRLKTKEPSGGYEQVLYGRVESFARLSDVTTGIFFVFFKAERVSFKLRDPDQYGEKANQLIRTLLTTDPKHTDEHGALGGVIMVLDSEGYVQLVRSEL
jgi:hypothetical protein